MTSHPLAEFRATYPDCELAALFDIAAGTTLVSACAIPTGQEHLDALCATARALFAYQTPDIAGPVFLSGPTGCRLFLRSPREVEEVFCAVFAPGTLPEISASEAAALFGPVSSQSRAS